MDQFQLIEQTGRPLVAIVDETYAANDDDHWPQAREEYRLRLQEEFGVAFEDGDIGPGASLPAFLTVLQTTAAVPVWTLVASTFFLGKPLNENLKAWQEMGKRLGTFFKRPVYLNREGAAIVAVDAVLEALNGLPHSIQLRSYRTQHVTDPDDLLAVEPSSEIAETLPTIYLGYVRHLFEIEANGDLFRVSVEGKKAKLHKIEQSTPM